MKRKFRVGLFMLVVFVLLASVIAYALERKAIKNSSNPNAYYTEQLSPETIRAVALIQNKVGTATGYGRALGMAIKDISQTYKITEITAINYSSGSNSVTVELIIRVEPE